MSRIAKFATNLRCTRGANIHYGPNAADGSGGWFHCCGCCDGGNSVANPHQAAVGHNWTDHGGKLHVEPEEHGS